MANRRMISSDIWEDDWFGQLDFFEQALWIGLFSKCADDQGRMLNNPVLIRAAVFPYKDVALKDVAEAISRFSDAGRVTLYTTDGKAMLQLVNWWEHQRPQWAQPSKWAAPDGWKDRIRTRDGGVYRTENWFESRETTKTPTPPTSNDEPMDTSNESTMQHTLSDTLSDNLVRQYPVPVPVSVPVQRERGAKPAPAADAATPETEPASSKRQDVRSDPRSKSAAIQCFRGVTRHYPLIELYDIVIDTLGDKPNGKLAADCYREWLKRGLNKNSLIWLTEWYAQGGPSNNGNGHAARGSPPTHDNDAWANMDVRAIIESNKVKEARHE